MNEPIKCPHDGTPMVIPAGAFEALCVNIHMLNTIWWHDPVTGKRLERNEGEMLALMHSELSEALEGIRKNKNDDHLPQYKSFPVELIDTVIRICDRLGELAINHNLPIAEILYAKLAYNATRADHTHAARREAGGKAF